MEKTQRTLMRNESSELKKLLKIFSRRCVNKVKLLEELKSKLVMKGFCTFKSPLCSGLASQTTFTRCRYNLKTEQNHYGKASCSHDAGIEPCEDGTKSKPNSCWYEMKTELLLA